MYMQCERNDQHIQNNKNHKDMQADQSYLNKKYNRQDAQYQPADNTENPDAKSSQTNTSYLYDTYRQPRLNMPSQTEFVKTDLNAMGKIHYPSQFMYGMVSDNEQESQTDIESINQPDNQPACCCGPTTQADRWRHVLMSDNRSAYQQTDDRLQCKSQPSIPSCAAAESAPETKSTKDCVCGSKSVPNIPQPHKCKCGDKAQSSMDPKKPGCDCCHRKQPKNDPSCSMGPNSTNPCGLPRARSMAPSTGCSGQKKTSEEKDNSTYYCLESGTGRNVNMQSEEGARETSTILFGLSSANMRSCVEPDFGITGRERFCSCGPGNATAYFSIESETNRALDNIGQRDKATTFFSVPSNFNNSSRAPNNDPVFLSIKSETNRTMDIIGPGDNDTTCVCAESGTTQQNFPSNVNNNSRGYSCACAPENTAAFMTLESGPNRPCDNIGQMDNGISGDDPSCACSVYNTTAYLTVESAISRQMNSVPQGDNATAYFSIISDCSRPNNNTAFECVEPATYRLVCPNVHPIPSCYTANQPTSCIETSLSPMALTNGQNECTNCTLDSEPSMRTIAFTQDCVDTQSTVKNVCSSLCIRNATPQLEKYFDADTSNITTSDNKSQFHQDENEAHGESEQSEANKVAGNHSSIGFPDKTSSRSQSVMAKVTCLCSSEEKLKLGIARRDYQKRPPFARVEDSGPESDVEPAGPLLISNEIITKVISRGVNCHENCKTSPSTKLVFMNRQDKFWDCHNDSDECEMCTCQSTGKVTAVNNYKSCLDANKDSTYTACSRNENVSDFRSANSGTKFSKSCVTTSKYGMPMPDYTIQSEPVGVVMTCQNNICLREGAMEQGNLDVSYAEQNNNFCECASERQINSYQSCVSSESSDSEFLKKRILTMLNILSDPNGHSLNRTLVIQNLFRDLTMLLRQGVDDADDDPPLSYEDCMAAVAAGRKPTKNEPSSKAKVERMQCLDQMEKYLQKCFPLPESQTGSKSPAEIVPFERDPNFDPYSKRPDLESQTIMKAGSKHFASCNSEAESDMLCSVCQNTGNAPCTVCQRAGSKGSSYKSLCASLINKSKSSSSKSKSNDFKSADSSSSKSKSNDFKSAESSLDSKSTDSKAPQRSVSPRDRKPPSGSESPHGSKSPNVSKSSGDSKSADSNSTHSKSKTPDDSTSTSAKKEEPGTEGEEEDGAKELCTGFNNMQKPNGPCQPDANDTLSPLSDRERLLCEYIMRRMCELCGDEQGLEEEISEGVDRPGEPCVCCHCRALVCDNQCKTVSKTLDAIRYDPVAETKFFIDSIICDLQAMEHVLNKNKINPKCPAPSPTMGNAPGESFPVTITDVSSLGCRALFVRWDLEDCAGIGGYEIYVDGHLTNRFYSFRHESGVVANVDVTKRHQIVLRTQAVGQEFPGDEVGCGPNAIVHAHPELLVGASRPWTPSVFFYEP